MFDPMHIVSVQRWAAILVAACIVTHAGTSAAFRTAGDLDEYAGTERVAWATEAVPYHLSTQNLGRVDVVELENAVKGAFSVWQTGECSEPFLKYEGRTPDLAAPGDGMNTVEWVTDGWEELGFPPGAGAFTDLGYVREDGGDWRIEEADLYINAQDHQWVVGGDSTLAKPLASLLVHEAGHILGLLHPCEVEPAGEGGAPECSSHPEMDEVAMHPLYDAERLTLQDDDIAGMCFLYPRSPDDDPSLGPESFWDCSGGDACPQGTTCTEGTCVAGTGLTGDPCADHTACESRACRDDGVCGALCRADEECATGEVCERFDAAAGTCSMGVRGGLGDECEDASQCLGGQCVDEKPGSRFCSRLCDEDECPADWVCKMVEERAVCVPHHPEIAGGCTVGPRGVEETRLGSEWALLILVAGSCVARASRHRRRSSRQRTAP